MFPSRGYFTSQWVAHFNYCILSVCTVTYITPCVSMGIGVELITQVTKDVRVSGVSYMSQLSHVPSDSDFGSSVTHDMVSSRSSEFAFYFFFDFLSYWYVHIHMSSMYTGEIGILTSYCAVLCIGYCMALLVTVGAYLTNSVFGYTHVCCFQKLIMYFVHEEYFVTYWSVSGYGIYMTIYLLRTPCALYYHCMSW